jgi:thiol-disulfide isomerase/thioredoxin
MKALIRRTVAVTGISGSLLIFAAWGEPATGKPSDKVPGTQGTESRPEGKTNENTAVSDTSEADKAWKDVKKALQPPMPPPEWSSQRPTPEQVEAFRVEQARLAGEAMDKARDFYTRFPDHPRAAEARKQERVIRFSVLKDSARRAFTTEKPGGRADMLANQEKAARELLKEFPEREDGYQMLLMIAGQAEADKAKALVNELLAGSAPQEIKTRAEGLLKKMDALGKPIAISFTAVDGREVDLSKMQGKVVLIDFWATWCGPCVAELPNVKLAYEQLHPKGFEIIGISFDREKDKLLKFVQDKAMEWPQYFDGKQWENKFGVEYGINSIPAMWLVDKKGKLRLMDARGRLADRVEALLAE